MKKVWIAVICFLVLAAGFFGGKESSVKKVLADAEFSAEDYIYYYDSINQTPRKIVNETVSALYNTVGCLLINEVENVTYVQVLDENDDEIEFEYDDEKDREYFYWYYNEVKPYKIKVVFCVEEEFETPYDITFEFTANCQNGEADFGAYFSSGGTTLTEASRLDSGKTYEVRARARGENFYWDDAAALYETDARCDLLELGGDGKHFVFVAPKAGDYILKFIVDSIPVEIAVIVNNPPYQVTLWDVLLGVAVLGALGAVAYFASKMSKGVEQQVG